MKRETVEKIETTVAEVIESFGEGFDGYCSAGVAVLYDLLRDCATVQRFMTEDHEWIAIDGHVCDPCRKEFPDFDYSSGEERDFTGYPGIGDVPIRRDIAKIKAALAKTFLENIYSEEN